MYLCECQTGGGRWEKELSREKRKTHLEKLRHLGWHRYGRCRTLVCFCCYQQPQQKYDIITVLAIQPHPVIFMVLVCLCLLIPIYMPCRNRIFRDSQGDRLHSDILWKHGRICGGQWDQGHSTRQRSLDRVS